MQLRARSSAVLGCLLLSWAGAAIAASTWNPTLLVNTEAFQVIDDSDSTANIQLQFGQTLVEKLYYDRTNLRFTFTRSLLVKGNLTATGSLNVSGTLSGSTLRVRTLSTSGALVYSSGSSLLNTARGSTGDLLISQGANAPIWKAPTGSILWYIDAGLAVTSSGSAVVTMPFGMTATSVNLRVKVAPTGAAIIVNIKKDGTTLFGTKPQIDAGARSGGSNAVFSVTNISAGSVLVVDIDQVGSTLTGSGLTIQLNGTRKY